MVDGSKIVAPEEGPAEELSSSELLKLNRPDEETQKARLEAVRGKRVLFVGGDFMYPAMADSLQDQLRRLRKLGAFIVGVFQEGKRGDYFKAAQDGGCLDEVLFADIGAEDGARNIAKAVKEADCHVECCWTPHEATQPIMVEVQHLLGLPGNPIEAYEKARDKYLTRKALEAAGLNTIKAMQVWKVEDADAVEEAIGFPMVIKPTVGMGSSGVYRANNRAELNKLLRRLFDDIKTDWTLNRNTIGKQAPVLAETFVVPVLYGDGKIDEFDVEVLMWDGEMVYSNIIDNWKTRPPFFAEVGSSAPSLVPLDMQQQMKDYAVKCVKALGFQRGGFHVEVWVAESGPLLIEINPRVGGGATVDTHQHVWGVDPMFEFALSMLDIPINPPRADRPICGYGYLLPNSEVTGTLHSEELTYLSSAQASTMHKSSKYSFKPGAFVKGNDRHVADWLGEVHLVHPDGLSMDPLICEIDRLHKDITHSSSLHILREEVVEEEETTA